MANAVEDELAGPTVFKDRSKLDYDWVPERLLHREKELGQLTQLFRGVAEGSTSARALVTGGVGVGKTALSKYFCRHLQDTLRARGVHVEYESVNCRKNAAEGLVLIKLLKKFDPNYPERGYSTQEMMRDLRKQIDRRGVHFVIILDEADALLRKDSELVYALTRFDDDRQIPKASLSLLLVSARDDLHDMLDAPTRSTIRRTNLVSLARYDATQLRGILADRTSLAFHKGTVEDEVLDLIAEIAAEEGDARFAIELLEGAGRKADEEHAEHVEAEHVRHVKGHIRPVVSEAKLRLLGEHQLFTLLAVARKLRRSRKTYLTTGEAEEAYKLVAEEYGEAGRAHTQFWKYLKELETADWFRLHKREGKASGLTHEIGLHDLPAAALAEKVEGLLAAETKAKAK